MFMNNHFRSKHINKYYKPRPSPIALNQPSSSCEIDTMKIRTVRYKSSDTVRLCQGSKPMHFLLFWLH